MQDAEHKVEDWVGGANVGNEVAQELLVPGLGRGRVGGEVEALPLVQNSARLGAGLQGQVALRLRLQKPEHVGLVLGAGTEQARIGHRLADFPEGLDQCGD